MSNWTNLAPSGHFSTLPGLSICTQFIGPLRFILAVLNGHVCQTRLVLLYICSILLTQSYASEQNSGPRLIRFPCAVCHKAVKWTTPGVCCDSCDVWYNVSPGVHAIGMLDCVLDGLKNLSWEFYKIQDTRYKKLYFPSVLAVLPVWRAKYTLPPIYLSLSNSR